MCPGATGSWDYPLEPDDDVRRSNQFDDPPPGFTPYQPGPPAKDLPPISRVRPKDLSPTSKLARLLTIPTCRRRWRRNDKPTAPEQVDYPDMPPEVAAQMGLQRPEQVDYPDMPPDMAVKLGLKPAPEQVDYPDMPEAEAIRLGLIDPLEAELKRRNVPGGLSATAGSTVTSTTPVQDIPAPKVNSRGETLPTYIFKELGKGLLSLPQRATQAAGELQRQGDVYDPAPAIETLLMGYGARTLAGAVTPRPVSPVFKSTTAPLPADHRSLLVRVRPLDRMPLPVWPRTPDRQQPSRWAIRKTGPRWDQVSQRWVVKISTLGTTAKRQRHRHLAKPPGSMLGQSIRP